MDHLLVVLMVEDMKKLSGAIDRRGLMPYIWGHTKTPR